MNPIIARKPPTRPASRLVGAIFAVLVLVPSLIGFGNKFLEFISLYRGEADGAFALTPILNYLLAAIGFFFMFCWAMAHGMFRDVESPKKDMLDVEDLLDSGASPNWILAQKTRSNP